ncbi:MAG: hypothetical protein V2B20_23850 [Pseudomonadota bacterium]
MEDTPDPASTSYTCNEYRAEMILLALHKKLQQPNLSENDRQEIAVEIIRLEKKIGMS